MLRGWACVLEQQKVMKYWQWFHFQSLFSLWISHQMPSLEGQTDGARHLGMRTERHRFSGSEPQALETHMSAPCWEPSFEFEASGSWTKGSPLHWFSTKDNTYVLWGAENKSPAVGRLFCSCLPQPTHSMPQGVCRKTMLINGQKALHSFKTTLWKTPQCGHECPAPECWHSAHTVAQENRHFTSPSLRIIYRFSFVVWLLPHTWLLEATSAHQLTLCGAEVQACGCPRRPKFSQSQVFSGLCFHPELKCDKIHSWWLQRWGPFYCLAGYRDLLPPSTGQPLSSKPAEEPSRLLTVPPTELVSQEGPVPL